jgi:hypothetical protein
MRIVLTYLGLLLSIVSAHADKVVASGRRGSGGWRGTRVDNSNSTWRAGTRLYRIW